MRDDSYWVRRSIGRRGVLRGGALGGAGVAAWALVGCGDDDNAPVKPSASTGTSGSSTTAAVSPTAIPTTAGKRGGTMRVTKRAADTGLDPAINTIAYMQTAKAYSHLLVYQLSANKFYLDLASSFEQAEPTRMVFKLRPDLKFAPNVANGRALTSEDIAYSFKRFPDALKNFGGNVSQQQFGWMDSFETPDASTFVIKLATPYASAVPLLGSSNFAVVARELVEANGGKLNDVLNAGSGPYMMTKRDATGTRYERNPNYYKHANPQGTFVEEGPFVDAWEELIIADLAAGEARFLAGDVDVLHVNQPGAIDKLKADELSKQKDVVVAKATNHVNFGFVFDNEKWAKYAKLREAISLAIDRDKWIRQIFVGEGIYSGPVAAIFDSALPQAELKQALKFDPARAKQLWTEENGNSVFPNGLKTVSPTFNESWTTSIDFVKRELEANLGISVKVNPADLATYLSLANARTKEWDFFMAGDSSQTTLPEINGLTFYVPTGYGSVFGNLRSDSTIPENKAFADKVTELNTQQLRELDAQKRKGLLQDMQRLFLKEFRPTFPLPIGAYAYAAYRSRVKNFPEQDFGHNNASAGVFRVQNLYLAS